MTTSEIASRLVELCRTGQFEAAYDQLFSQDAENIEMPGNDTGALGNARGLAAMRAKGAAWSAGVETIHSMDVGEPIVAANWFALTMKLDITMKGAGRMQMEEICLYQVKNGKIVREQFFYDAG